MKLKWILSITTLSLLTLVAVFGLAGHDSAVAAQDVNSKIEATLLDKFTTDGSADYIVRFVEQADLSAAYSMDWAARGEFVVNTLKQTAANSQVNAVAILDKDGLKHQTFIAGNEIYVWSGTQVDASALAALPEVDSIRATRTYAIDPSLTEETVASINWVGDLVANNMLTTVKNAPEGLAWGITYTKADQFWATYGVQGDGIKVANIDTGVQWNHPALDQAFACPGQPNNSACWSDPENWCGAGGACDNNGHGTHTMGTMVGDDDPALTWEAGMAPSATWIACKGCGTTSCSDFALNSCADWILNPGGSSANRPNVVNNSWGGTPDGNPWYEPKVQAWRAAGVFPAFSAGNSGPSCGSLGDPGSYQSTFASGMINSAGQINSLSSRGPSAFGTFTKPNIAAPGVSVCSSIPTNGWSCGYTGTSMASPHSAGAVALLWSCNPALVGQIDQTIQLLQNSATDTPAGNCGTSPDGGDYAYGYGYLDVLAAGATGCSGVELGTLEGHVYDQDNNPVEGATVTAVPGLNGNSIDASTDPNGFYTMDLPAGTYDVTASKANYSPQTVEGVVVVGNETTTQDFAITFTGGVLEGTVTDDSNNPVADVDITVQPGGFGATTNASGFYTLQLDAGTYSVTASKIGFQTETVNGVVVVANQTTTQDFQLLFLGAWTQLPNGAGCPDWTRMDMEYFPANQLVYVMGGRNGTIFEGGIFSYNPATNTCANTGLTMPQPVANYTIVLLNDGTDDLLCTFGGNFTSTDPSNAVQCFNPVANTVSIVDTLPASLAAFIPGGVTVVDNTVYVYGGFRNWTTPYNLAETWSYDPTTGTWTQLGDLPMGLGYIENSVVDGKIYGFGGDIYDGVNLVAQTIAEVFDPATGTWDDAAVADLPTASGEGRGFGFDSTSSYNLAGKVILAGGGLWPADTNAVVSYDVATDTYDEAFPDLNITRRDQAGFFVPGTPGAMWVFGGRSDALGGDNPPYGPPEFYEVPISLSADLAIAKTASPDPAHVGQDLTYTLTVTNNGPDDATGVKTADALPTGVTFVSASAGCTYDAGTGVVSCAIATLASGETKQVTITVTPTEVGTLTNTATIVGDQPDPVPGNNTSTVETTVLPAQLYFYLPLVYK